jgi:hypothetical protein
MQSIQSRAISMRRNRPEASSPGRGSSRRTDRYIWRAVPLLVGATVLWGAQAVSAGAPDDKAAAATARALVAEFGAACPVAAQSDEAAHQSCGEALAASNVARHLKPIIFWGGEKPGVSLNDARLTRLGATLWTRLYLSLFMTDGTVESLRWDDAYHLFRLSVRVAFRNEMAPGRYPYPFWHQPAKWEAYEQSHILDFLIAPDDGLVAVAFRQPVGNGPAGVAIQPVKREPFDGKWMWRDQTGQLQPVVTLFQGIYRAQNPELARLDATYREMALALRESSCMDCHTPANPHGMKKLVLLQTPAHAADRIDRVVRMVKIGEMPYEDWDIPRPLQGAQLEAFLARAEAFQNAVHAANAWELATPR